jgi:hypothetical protein
MKVRNIIHENYLNEDTVLSKHNYKKEVHLLSYIEDRNRNGHELCDYLINLIMVHRARGVKLIDEIRKLVLEKKYDEAEKMIEEVDELLKELRENSLLKEIVFHIF